MYAALLSGSIAAIFAAWKFIPGLLMEMFHRSVVEGFVTIAFIMAMAAILMCLGYLGASLTNITFKGITEGWNK
jgi:hypothetical protein